jgi:hypothetical protein
MTVGLLIMNLPDVLLRYGVGLGLEGIGVYLALRPDKIGRIGFGRSGGAVPEEIPPLPRWVGPLPACRRGFQIRERVS